MVQCTPVNAGVTLTTKCSDNDGELTLTWKEEAAIEGGEGGVFSDKLVSANLGCGMAMAAIPLPPKN